MRAWVRACLCACAHEALPLKSIRRPWYGPHVPALLRVHACMNTRARILVHKHIHTHARMLASTQPQHAVRDSRFSPVSASELKHLSCKVSLLSCFERAASWWVGVVCGGACTKLGGVRAALIRRSSSRGQHLTPPAHHVPLAGRTGRWASTGSS